MRALRLGLLRAFAAGILLPAAGALAQPPGPVNPTEITAVGNVAFFAATDAATGTELWKTDGSASGTVRVRDIVPGTGSSSPANLFNLNGTLYFSIGDFASGHELWRSDGTAGGTTRVKTLGSAGSTFNVSHATATGNGLLFFMVHLNTSLNFQHRQIWRSDGTEPGTFKVFDLTYSRHFEMNMDTLAVLANQAYFGAPAYNGAPPGLYKTDGSVAGTVFVTEVSTTLLENLTVAGGKLLFSTGSIFGGILTKLWASDGTSGGTTEILAKGGTQIDSSGVFFTYDELWRTDGTAAGTSFLKTIGPLCSGATTCGSRFTTAGGKLFTSGRDAAGNEPWTTDGTASGTALVMDVRPGSASSLSPVASPPGIPQPLFAELNGSVLFAANDGTSGAELWRSDGTPAGTALVKDIAAGAASSSPAAYAKLGGFLLFSADDGANGRQLWRSDGTAGGTLRVFGSPQLSVAGGSSIAEGQSGTANAVFVVTLSPAATDVVTIGYATSDGTASAGSDYTATSGTLTFNPGETSKQVLVPVNGDTHAEPDETIRLTLHTPSGASIGSASGSAAITNDDGTPPALSIVGVTQTEGLSGTSAFDFAVTLQPASTLTVTVQYATADGNAASGEDYTATTGMLTFNPGETAKTVTVNVKGDAAAEPDETFTLPLTGATNAAVPAATATGTILNDDGPAPLLTVGAVALPEGRAGLKPASFPVTLSAPSSLPVTVQFHTVDGSSTSPSDYVSAAGSLTLAAGQTSGAIEVSVRGDADLELDETFTLALDAPTNAQLDAPAATGTILNDDNLRRADFNLDGRDDILWRNVGPGPATGALFVWLMNGRAIVGASYLDPISMDWQIQGVGDFNADGRADILWRNMNPAAPDTARLYVWLMDGAHTIAGTGYVSATADLGWRVIGVDDVGWQSVDSTGKADVIWRNETTGDVYLWEMVDGTHLGPIYLLGNVSSDWQLQGTGEFHADGRRTLTWRNVNASSPDAGALYAWNGYYGGGPVSNQADLTWEIHAIGDLDGDKRADLVWRKVGPGPDTGAIFVWFMDGATKVRSGTYLNPISTDWRIVGSADFNGDGKSDILWRNYGSGPDQGYLYVWLMDGATVIGGTGYTNSQADFTWDVKNPR